MKEEIKKYLFENYKIKNGEIKQGRTTKTELDIVKQLLSYAVDQDKEWNKATILDSIKEWKESLEEIKSRPIDDIVKIFIKERIEARDLSYKKDTWYMNGVSIEEEKVFSIFEADVYDWNRTNNEQKFSISELTSKLNLYKIEEATKQTRKLLDKISHKEEKIDKLKEWLLLIHSAFKIKEDFDVFEMMFCHWLWQVKRRSIGLNTVNELFINFYGKTGTGKTYLVRLITNIFADFRVMNGALDALMDERRIPELANNFIHFVDELASNSNTVFVDKDISTLKQIITATDPLSYRKLGTNTQYFAKPRTSMIAASNFHIYDVIMDSSGMRRFFEFNVGLDTNRYDVEATAKIQELTTDAWIGINENLEYGYWDFVSPTNKKISEIQEKYVTKTAFELWLDSVEFTTNSVKTQIKEVYSLYTDFCEDECLKHKMITIQTFSRKLQEEGIPLVSMHGKKYIKGIVMKKPEYNQVKPDEIFDTTTKQDPITMLRNENKTNIKKTLEIE